MAFACLFVIHDHIAADSRHRIVAIFHAVWKTSLFNLIAFSLMMATHPRFRSYGQMRSLNAQMQVTFMWMVSSKEKLRHQVNSLQMKHFSLKCHDCQRSIQFHICLQVLETILRNWKLCWETEIWHLSREFSLQHLCKCVPLSRFYQQDVDINSSFATNVCSHSLHLV